MNKQTPAEGISAMRQYPNLTSFKVPCECGCDEEILFSIESDELSITAHFYSNTRTNSWRDRIKVSFNEPWLVFSAKVWFNDWYNRIAIALTALVKGQVITESYVLMSKQQALNFSSTLVDTIADHERKQKERFTV